MARGHHGRHQIAVTQHIQVGACLEALARERIFHAPDDGFAGLCPLPGLLHQIIAEFFVQAGIFQADGEMLRIEDPPGCHREHPIKEGAEDGTYEDEQLIQKVRDFLFMNYEDIEKIVYGTPENAETRASHTAEDMLANRAVDSGMPYGPQSVRELGCVGMDYAWVPGPFITLALADEVQDKASGRAHSWDYYEGQWDGGKLMNAFLNQEYYAKESSQHIQTWVKAILGL